MSKFLCLDCADKIPGEFESLTVGVLGKRACDLCGRIVDIDTEPRQSEGMISFNYHVVRDELLLEIEDVDTWFSLSYAAWLAVPRIVMESMPLEWQHAMTKLLNEMNDTFDWMPDDLCLNVIGRKGNRFVQLPRHLCDYRRGSIEHLRKKKDL